MPPNLLPQTVSKNMHPRRLKRQRGSVTAEFAVLLPTVTLLLAFVLTCAQLGLAQMRVSEAAQAGARAAARGDQGMIPELVQQVAGAGAAAVVSREGQYVVVTVKVTVGGGLTALIGGMVSATASARTEEPAVKHAPVEPPRRSR